MSRSVEARRRVRDVAERDGDLREAILVLLNSVGYQRQPLIDALGASLHALALDPGDPVERRAAELLRAALQSGVFFD